MYRDKQADKQQSISEAELLNGQRQQAELLDLTHDAIVIRDQRGTIIFWNRGAQKTYGFTKQEAVGQKIHSLLKTEFPKPLEEIEQDMTENSLWEGELIQFTRENARVVVASRWVIKDDSEGHPFSVMEINNNITAQKEADNLRLAAQEKAAEDVLTAAQKKEANVLLLAAQQQAQVLLLAAQRTRSDERLRLVVEAAPHALVMVDLNGNIALVNSQFENLFGYEREELLGQSIKRLAPTEEQAKSKAICRDDEDEFYDRAEQSLSPGRSSDKPPATASFFLNPAASVMTKGDFWGQRKDATVIPVEIALNPLTIDKESFILASIIEITERNLREELMREKLTELAASNHELEQFAYVCSHDLQEPLRVISNYTHLLAKRYQGKLDEKADQFMEFTLDASKRMQTLINDLLTFSRLKSKAQVFGKVDCSQTVKMAIANLKVAIEEANATITFGKLPTVNGDSSQLLQLFQNLIGNGIKFRSQEPTAIEISVLEKGAFWLFGVHDNGIGIDMQFADRIFVIFQRLHVKEKYAGSGIGLAVCKTVVQRHGGRIWMESMPNKGTTFYFTLPKMT